MNVQSLYNVISNNGQIKKRLPINRVASRDAADTAEELVSAKRQMAECLGIAEGSAW